MPKKRTQWSEIEDDPTEDTSESAPKAKPKSEEPPKTKAKSEVSSKAKAKSDEPPKTKAKSEGPPKAKSKPDPEAPQAAKVKPTPAPATLNPAAATVAVRPSSSTEENFLLQNAGGSEWPVDEPQAKLPMWKKKDSFLSTFLNHKVIIANCPTGSGKVNYPSSTRSHALASTGRKGLLHPD